MKNTTKLKKTKDQTPESETGVGKSSMLGKLGLPLVLGITSFCTVYFLPQNTSAGPRETASEDHQIHEDAQGGAEFVKTSFITLEPFTVSLKGRARILRLNITVEAPQEWADSIDPHNPKLRDAFMGYLSALGMEQVEDPAFLVKLRAQLTRRAQFVLGEDKVQNILITDFVVR